MMNQCGAVIQDVLYFHPQHSVTFLKDCIVNYVGDLYLNASFYFP